MNIQNSKCKFFDLYQYEMISKILIYILGVVLGSSGNPYFFENILWRYFV